MKTPSDELKPCPFCGSAPELIDARLRFVVRCTQCGCANVPKKWHGEFDEDGHREATDDDIASWKAEAIAAWNTRPEAAQEIERLKEALGEARNYIANCWIDPVAADEERALVAKIDAALSSSGEGV